METKTLEELTTRQEIEKGWLNKLANVRVGDIVVTTHKTYRYVLGVTAVRDWDLGDGQRYQSLAGSAMQMGLDNAAYSFNLNGSLTPTAIPDDMIDLQVIRPSMPVAAVEPVPVELPAMLPVTAGVTDDESPF